MKHSGKTALFVTALLAISSCNRFDRTSPLGADLISGLDSGAISYDGAYTTENYPLGTSDLLVMTDPLSGLHRYADSISHGGRIQTDMIIGQFSNERSFGYVSFMPKYFEQTGSLGSVKDSIVTNTPGRYVDSLLSNGYDMVNTALTFTINANSNTEEYYNLRLSTCPYVADSTRIDTTKHHVMQNVLVPGNLSAFTVDLPYDYYSKKTNDPVWLSSVSGMIVSPRVDTVETIQRKWNAGLYKDDTLAQKIVPHTDTTYFKESKILNYTMFSKISSFTNDTTAKIVSVGGDSIQTLIGSRTVSSNTVIDTVIHKWKNIALSDSSTDYLYVTKADSEKKDTVREYKIEKVGIIFDSLYTINRTVTSYNGDTITQNMKRKLETVKFGRAYTATNHDSLSYKALDSLNIMIKNMTSDSSLFHLKSVTLRIIAAKNGIYDTVNSISISPSRATMTVFNTAPASTEPVISGGLEQFVRLKVNTLPFWTMMRSEQYMSIVHSTIQIPVNTTKTKIPYRNSRINVKYFLHSKSQLNGELLLTASGKAKSIAFDSYQDVLKLDITDLLLDQCYGDTNLTPDTYLYLWIDGASMGQIVLDQAKDYQFTYIAQNKK